MTDPSATIVRELVAVSADAVEHAAASSQAGIVARYQDIAQASAREVFVYFYTHDPSKAAAWIRAASRYSDADINAMPVRQQYETVMAMWGAFGNFWQASNLSPYAWAPFRKACESAWCARPSSVTGTPPRGSPYWRGRVVVENHPGANDDILPGKWFGAWRDAALASFRQYGGGEGSRTDSLGPDQVIFGDPTSWHSENIGCQNNNRCHAPTGETHRVWMQFDGTITGGNLYGSLATSEGVAGPGLGVTVPWPYNGVGTMSGDWRSDDRWQAKPVTSANRLWYIPPLVWYWRLLRAPIPGLKIGGAGPDVSLVAYLAAQDPYVFAREVLLDVVTRNKAMASANGVTDTSLAAKAGTLFQRSETDRVQTISEVSGMTHAFTGLLAPLASLGPVGAGVALAGGAIDLVTTLITPALTPDSPRPIDVFGRLMPAYEYSIVTTDYTAFVENMRAIGLPEAAPRPQYGFSSVLPTDFATPSMTGGGAPAPTATPLSQLATLEFLGITPGAAVFVDDVEQSPGWWDDATGGYRINIRPGDHSVRVVDPDGTQRSSTTSAAMGQTTSLMPALFTSPEDATRAALTSGGGADATSGGAASGPTGGTDGGVSMGAVALGGAALAALAGGAWVLSQQGKRRRG